MSHGAVRGSLRGPGPPPSPPDVSPPCPLVSPQLQAQKLRLAHSRGPFYSGSLPNVNQIGTGVPEFQVIHSRIGGLAVSGVGNRELKG